MEMVIAGAPLHRSPTVERRRQRTAHRSPLWRAVSWLTRQLQPSLVDARACITAVVLLVCAHFGIDREAKDRPPAGGVT
jgi:hypothetical protein